MSLSRLSPDEQEAGLVAAASETWSPEQDRAALGRVAEEEAQAREVASFAAETETPTGCWHCLNRIGGRTSAPCPSHGVEWEVGDGVAPCVRCKRLPREFGELCEPCWETTHDESFRDGEC
jgi:hypothetical protein